MPFDAQGQPLAATLADYLLPGCVEMPSIRICHMETPSPYTEFGQKGVGEGGAIGPAAAIANAVNDAMRTFGVELCEILISPPRVLKALAAAKAVSVDGEHSGLR
jgi:carbon-monoxide dehydrogenase large subunit